MMPTDALNRPAWQFWMDARIRAAGAAWETEQQKAARNGRSTQQRAGAATDAEKKTLVDDQERRAERREQQDGQPGLDDQLSAVRSGPAGDS
jgi:hypothetical protein